MADQRKSPWDEDPRVRREDDMVRGVADEGDEAFERDEEDDRDEENEEEEEGTTL